MGSSQHVRTAPRGPVVVVVMDGVGVGAPDDPGDAVARAHTPTLDRLRALPSATELAAHGLAVGLPSDKDMGNSEVGHNAIGAGRIFDQGAKLINEAIESGRLFEGEVWQSCCHRVRHSGEPLHFVGLLSDGNVHSHIDHLFALIDRAEAESVERVRVHALLDGRDVPARSALTYVDRLEQRLAKARANGRDYLVASGGGRMTTTMDRYEADWEMVSRGYAVHVRGEGRQFPSLREAVQTLYDETGLGDQDLPSFVIARDGEPIGPIRDGAAVILFNFRGDRAIEFSRAMTEAQFDAFERGPLPDVAFAGMMEYDGDLHIPPRYLVSPPEFSNTLGERLALAGKRQLAISETQKYGHVTYFWNGNRAEAFDPTLETYVEIPSDSLPFEQRPWMKAAEITDRLIRELRTGSYDHARVNYANGDMVGHTGHLDATIAAVQCVDLCLARLLPVIDAMQGVLVVTADHGNADHMIDDGKPRTSHSLNPVPCIVYDPRFERGPALADLDAPGLGNLAATVLDLMGLEVPPEYLPSLLAPLR